MIIKFYNALHCVEFVKDSGRKAWGFVMADFDDWEKNNHKSMDGCFNITFVDPSNSQEICWGTAEKKSWAKAIKGSNIHFVFNEDGEVEE